MMKANTIASAVLRTDRRIVSNLKNRIVSHCALQHDIEAGCNEQKVIFYLRTMLGILVYKGQWLEALILQ